MTVRKGIGSYPFFFAFLLIFSPCFFSGNPSARDIEFERIKRSIPEKYRPAVARSLVRSGDNRGALSKAMAEVTADRIGMVAFVVANMPYVDLAGTGVSSIVENIEYADRARNFSSWSKAVPEDIFLHYVLPHRVAQEPLTDWRRLFHDSLSLRLARLTSPVSMADAAREVDRWCGELVTYKVTQYRDQSPIASITSGYGRCEEIVIVQISGYRSIGIPARPAWTPYWPHCDDNHAWTETWIDGAWTGIPAKRAALVFAPVYGLPPNDTTVYRKSENFALLNVTGNYTPTGIVKVKTVRKGKPVSGMPVTVSVFNYGSLRPIARLTSDRAGYCAITIGAGEYFVSGGTITVHAAQKCRVDVGLSTEVLLELDLPKPLDGRFWLRYKNPD